MDAWEPRERTRPRAHAVPIQAHASPHALMRGYGAALTEIPTQLVTEFGDESAGSARHIVGAPLCGLTRNSASVREERPRLRAADVVR